MQIRSLLPSPTIANVTIQTIRDLVGTRLTVMMERKDLAAPINIA
jgi:hypothetical protein